MAGEDGIGDSALGAGLDADDVSNTEWREAVESAFWCRQLRKDYSQQALKPQKACPACAAQRRETCFCYLHAFWRQQKGGDEGGRQQKGGDERGNERGNDGREGRSIEKWTEGTKEAGEALLEVERLLNDVPFEPWSALTDEHFQGGKIKSVLFSALKDDVELLTNGWLKMFELLARFSPFGENSPPLNAVDSECDGDGNGDGNGNGDGRGPETFFSLHLGELPGGFVAATNHYVRTHRPKISWEWRATTLDPTHEQNDWNATLTDDTFFNWTYKNWLLGADGTGSLLRHDNILHTVKSLHKTLATARAAKRVSSAKSASAEIVLVTGDASFDTTHDPENQEELLFPLKLAEIIVALCVLKPLPAAPPQTSTTSSPPSPSPLSCSEPPGTFILKIYGMLTPASTSLVAFLAHCFRFVKFAKPVASKPGNAELYVVAQGFVGVSSKLFDSVRGYLMQVIADQDAHPNANVSARPASPQVLFPISAINASLLAEVQAIASENAWRQRSTILQNLQAFLAAHGELVPDRQRDWLAKSVAALLTTAESKEGPQLRSDTSRQISRGDFGRGFLARFEIEGIKKEERIVREPLIVGVGAVRGPESSGLRDKDGEPIEGEGAGETRERLAGTLEARKVQQGLWKRMIAKRIAAFAGGGVQFRLSASEKEVLRNDDHVIKIFENHGDLGVSPGNTKRSNSAFGEMVMATDALTSKSFTADFRRRLDRFIHDLPPNLERCLAPCLKPYRVLSSPYFSKGIFRRLLLLRGDLLHGRLAPASYADICHVLSTLPPSEQLPRPRAQGPIEAGQGSPHEALRAAQRLRRLDLLLAIALGLNPEDQSAGAEKKGDRDDEVFAASNRAAKNWQNSRVLEMTLSSTNHFIGSLMGTGSAPRKSGFASIAAMPQKVESSTSGTPTSGAPTSGGGMSGLESGGRDEVTSVRVVEGFKDYERLKSEIDGRLGQAADLVVVDCAVAEGLRVEMVQEEVELQKWLLRALRMAFRCISVSGSMVLILSSCATRMTASLLLILASKFKQTKIVRPPTVAAWTQKRFVCFSNLIENQSLYKLFTNASKLLDLAAADGRFFQSLLPPVFVAHPPFVAWLRRHNDALGIEEYAQLRQMALATLAPTAINLPLNDPEAHTHLTPMTLSRSGSGLSNVSEISERTTYVENIDNVKGRATVVEERRAAADIVRNIYWPRQNLVEAALARLTNHQAAPLTCLAHLQKNLLFRPEAFLRRLDQLSLPSLALWSLQGLSIFRQHRFRGLQVPAVEDKKMVDADDGDGDRSLSLGEPAMRERVDQIEAVTLENLPNAVEAHEEFALWAFDCYSSYRAPGLGEEELEDVDDSALFSLQPTSLHASNVRAAMHEKIP